jgi:broad specificity phosphatase PhoE
VRHGKTSFNKGNDEESRLKGTEYDLPLTEEGHAEAERVAQFIAQFPIASLHHSDMLRSQQTAKHIEDVIGVKSFPDVRFDPWDVGYLSGHTRASAKDRIEYYIRNASKVVPEGESYQDFFDTFESGLLAEMKASEKEHNSPTYKARVVVSHSCNSMATDAIVNGDDPKFHSENIEQPGSVRKLSKKAGKWNMADVDLSGPGSR